MLGVPLLVLPFLASCTLVSDVEVEAKLRGEDSGAEGGRGLAFEEGPDRTSVTLNENLEIVLDTLEAQDLGELSTAGFLDTIDGSLTLSGTEGWSGNDADAFAFTVAAAQQVRLAATWGYDTNDLDFGIFGRVPAETGPYVDWFSTYGETHCRTDVNPEVCLTAAPLSADTSYYLLALAYLGSGDEPYHIELEWDP